MKLGPEEYNNKDPQAVVVVLPKKEVVTELGAPAAGAKQWYSGAGNGLENTMTRTVAVPATAPSLTLPGAVGHRGLRSRPVRLRLRRGVHRRWDHLDGASPARSPSPPRATGSTARRRRTRRRRSTCPPTPARRSACGSATPVTRRHRATTTRSRTASSSTRSRSQSGATTVFADGAETGANGWTLAGWSSVGASTSQLFDNYYIAGHRSYVSYDKYLKTGPYYFGYANRQAGQGRPLRVPAGAPDLLLGHVAGQQRHDRPPGCGPEPVRRRPPDPVLQARRRAVAGSRAGLRRAVRPEEG